MLRGKLISDAHPPLRGIVMMQLLLMVAVGLISGLVMSLIGASAVMVIVPSLSLVFGYAMHVAIGVSLLVDVIASVAVSYTYWRHGNVDLRQGMWIALGSVIGAQFGAGCIVLIPEWFLAVSYGIWMIGSGAIIWKKGLDRTAVAERFKRYLEFDSRARRVVVSLGLGLGIGVNCGIFGAGGGILIMLVLIFVLNFSVHKAIGTSTVIMAVTAASATVGYGMRGNIEVFASVVIALGTVAGGLAGARFANLASESSLSRIVGGIFMALGIVITALRMF